MFILMSLNSVFMISLFIFMKEAFFSFNFFLALLGLILCVIMTYSFYRKVLKREKKIKVLYDHVTDILAGVHCDKGE